jgi:hypothetical protein
MKSGHAERPRIKPLLQVRTASLQFRNTIDDIDHQVEPVNLVVDRRTNQANIHVHGWKERATSTLRWNISALIAREVQKAGILVSQTIVVLAPDERRDQKIERRDGNSRLQPLCVLVVHRIDDVDEGLIAVEASMATGQKIAFQPASGSVLAGRGPEMYIRPRSYLRITRLKVRVASRHPSFDALRRSMPGQLATAVHSRGLAFEFAPALLLNHSAEGHAARQSLAA